MPGVGFGDDDIRCTTQPTIIEVAQAEIDADERLASIKDMKATILASRAAPWYKKMFPYKITIERIEYV